MTFTLNHEYVTVTCCHDGCGIPIVMSESYYRQVKNDPKRWWFCLNGHTQHFTAEATDAAKLQKAQAREVALQDQLGAAVRDAEQVRAALLRDRHRFANGVCPCCNRSFENVARHMRGEHPDYDVTKVAAVAAPTFACSCGRTFDTLRGLRTHQGHQRRPGWETSTSRWAQHRTKV